MKKKLLVSVIFLIFIFPFIIKADDKVKTQSIYEVCEGIKSDILHVYDEIRSLEKFNDDNIAKMSEEEKERFDKIYWEANEIQLINIKMFSGLGCKKWKK